MECLLRFLPLVCLYMSFDFCDRHKKKALPIKRLEELSSASRISNNGGEGGIRTLEARILDLHP